MVQLLLNIILYIIGITYYFIVDWNNTGMMNIKFNVMFFGILTIMTFINYDFKKGNNIFFNMLKSIFINTIKNFKESHKWFSSLIINFGCLILLLVNFSVQTPTLFLNTIYNISSWWIIFFVTYFLLERFYTNNTKFIFWFNIYFILRVLWVILLWWIIYFLFKFLDPWKLPILLNYLFNILIDFIVKIIQ